MSTQDWGRDIGLGHVPGATWIFGNPRVGCPYTVGQCCSPRVEQDSASQTRMGASDPRDTVLLFGVRKSQLPAGLCTDLSSEP